jgi:hypothetical protein
MAKASIVKVGKKKCRPFLLEVMVMHPEAGFKFEVVVEKGCSPENDPIWKLVFDLYKKKDQEFIQIVHVSFRAEAPKEVEGVRSMAFDGASPEQARILVEEVHPAAKKFADKQTAETQDKLKTAMHLVAVAEL